MTEPGAEQAPSEPILSVHAAPGRLTGAYDVQKPVGKGGYAVVYKGIRREDGRVVAVKKVEVGAHAGALHSMHGACGCAGAHCSYNDGSVEHVHKVSMHGKHAQTTAM